MFAYYGQVDGNNSTFFSSYHEPYSIAKHYFGSSSSLLHGGQPEHVI
jgi:hypothetical protein